MKQLIHERIEESCYCSETDDAYIVEIFWEDKEIEKYSFQKNKKVKALLDEYFDDNDERSCVDIWDDLLTFVTSETTIPL